ncbi:MAG TPA: hypothetical protein VMY40_02760 [Anaerolineae bacterium]|nr:hypothetical protein [Anaerolineae bacterium]
MSSLEALRRKVNLETLALLQPLMLLQMVVGVSQTVNESVSNSQALARTLLLSGQQRLRELLDAAPRLHLPVERVLELCRADDAERTPEEAAAQALFELCLGLMLHWMAETAGQRRTIFSTRSEQPVSPSYFLAYPPLRSLRARSCPYLALA